MYIEPNTQIHILQGVPLSKTYEHTVRYKNATDQYNGFIAYKKHTLNNYSYQRVGLGTLRVQLPYSEVYNCNYMIFKNTSYENRWFYAFITGVSYLSNDVSEIYYLIDVMQTFAYDYQFKKCFIERAHESTDIIYDNTQPEGLELGSDYRINSYHGINTVTKDNTKKRFLILATTNQSGVHPTASVVDNTVYALKSTVLTGVDELKSTIQAYIDNGYASNIISVYTVPDLTVPTLSFTRKRTIDGYEPKNMKLYCYPFTFIEMNNRTGDALELKYENFFKITAKEHISSLSNEFKFNVQSGYSLIPESRLLPLNYLEGSTDGIPRSSLTNGYNIGYSLYPQGAISDDSFKAWLAQNQNSYIASLNAIGQQYDTNMAIAQNAYDMASRSASASLESNSNSINTALANAQMANATASNVNRRSANAGSVANLAKMGTGLLAGAIAQNPLAVLNTGVNAITAQNNINVNEQNTADTLATQLLTADNSAMTALANSNLAYTTAMKNAATSQASATLSAVTSANIATAQLVAKKQDAEHQPSNLRGQVMAYGINTSFGLIGFSIFEKCIRSEYAQMIDDYFEKYGYAIRRLETPNVTARPHWTYIKTCGCNIVGNLSAQDIATIQGIYDNGITTWKSLSEVYNYDLDNHAGIPTER